VSGGRLAGAVSLAGGLGLIGGGYGDSGWVDREWERAGNARVGCGFITWSLAQRPQILERALAHRPAAIMLSFGDPRPFAPAIRAAGARLICQVQTVSQAREATEAGADIIVAQGTEAGGHGMSEPLFALLPQVVDVCPGTLIVAAGGIADGRGMAAALMLGAQGVLMGTRFYASQEAMGHPAAKQRIVEAEGGQTVRSIVFDLSRRMRCLLLILAVCCATATPRLGWVARASWKRGWTRLGASTQQQGSEAISTSLVSLPVRVVR